MKSPSDSLGGSNNVWDEVLGQLVVRMNKNLFSMPRGPTKRSSPVISTMIVWYAPLCSVE